MLNEVRESLTMPMAPALIDECGDDDEEADDGIEVSDYDVASVTSANTAANTAANSGRYKHTKLPRKSNNNNSMGISSAASVSSMNSTNSARPVFSFFGKQKSNVADDDDNTVSSTKSKGWWNRNRSSKTSDKTKGRLPMFKSFRFKKKPNKRSGRNTNDRLVADFFDVQSLASEPDFMGSRQLKKATMHESGSSRMLETRSVSSTRSTRSISFFGSFFHRMKVINDEVEGIEDDEDDTPDFTGTGIDAYEGDFVDDDEELTLGSGFDSSSLADSLQDDEYSVDSRGSYQSRESFQSAKSTASEKKTSSHNIKAVVEPKQEKQPEEHPFLQRIFQRRSLKNEDTILRKAVGRIPSATESSSESDHEEEPKRSSPPIHRGKSLMQGNMMHSSSKSLGAMPVSANLEINLRTGSSESVPEERPRGPDNRGLCRWDSDHTIMSNPMAPKRPKRRTESEDGGGASSPAPALKTPPTAKKDQKPLKKLPTSSQSMRNLNIHNEFKRGSDDEDDDDDSVLSLLSGLLASWSAERDGINLIATITRAPVPSNASDDARTPKSILKISSPDVREERKEDSREQYKVVFAEIEIREYERVVGDNPSCSRGPPISIGWAYMIAHRYPLNDYEQLIRPPRRSKKEFHLAADKRTDLLVNEWECSEEDIRKARREATYIQYCRAKTSFSGSRAAAKEAAFLRKASDRSKQVVVKKKSTMVSTPTTESTPKPINKKVTLASTPTTESNPKPANKTLTMESTPITESSPKPASRRASEPEASPPTVVGRLVLPPTANSPSSSARHRPLLEV